MAQQQNTLNVASNKTKPRLYQKSAVPELLISRSIQHTRAQKIVLVLGLYPLLCYSETKECLLWVLRSVGLLCSYHAYALFRTCMAQGGATVATGASQIALIYTLLRVLPPWPGVPEPSMGGIFSMRVAVLRTGVLGVCAIGILAGFGTVAFPYSVLRAFVVPVNPYEVKALQTQLALIREQVWSAFVRPLHEAALRTAQSVEFFRVVSSLSPSKSAKGG
jgi:hypothetical protein